MNKRGLSDVVTTVLIILLVIAAVAIIWVFARGLITESTGQIEISSFSASVNVAPGTVRAVSTGDKVSVNFNAQRGKTEGEISAINVVVQDSDGVSKNYRYNLTTPFKILETKKITAQFEGLKDASKITIIPVVKNLEGKEIPSRVSREYVIRKDEILIPPAGLIGYWKFDEDKWDRTEGEVKDSSASNAHGTASQGESIAPNGISGNAGSFTSGTNGIELVNDAKLSIANEKDGVTMIAWVKLDQALNDYHLIGGYGPNPFQGYALDLDGNIIPNTLNSKFKIKAWGGKVDTIQGGWRISNNVLQSDSNSDWTFVAAAIKKSGFIYTFYTEDDNKNLISDTKLHSEINLEYPGDKRLGARYDGASALIGQMDEVMIYDRVLSEDEIKKIYKFFKR